MIDLSLAARCAGLISACYDSEDTLSAYRAIDPAPFGCKMRDVILADELGFTGVPVGIMVEDLVTEEIGVVLRGTRVIANGPNEWEVDGQFALDPCPFVPGGRSHRGFTTTWRTFRLSNGSYAFPAVQLVTGHSLAAAWGLLAAAFWKANLISFAGPRVGDSSLVAYANQAIPSLVRFVNRPDIVPDVPLDIWPWFEYIHAEGEHGFDGSAWINQDLPFKTKLEAFHSIHVYWHAVDPSHPIPTQFAP